MPCFYCYKNTLKEKPFRFPLPLIITFCRNEFLTVTRWTPCKEDKVFIMFILVSECACVHVLMWPFPCMNVGMHVPVSVPVELKGQPHVSVITFHLFFGRVSASLLHKQGWPMSCQESPVCLQDYGNRDAHAVCQLLCRSGDSNWGPHIHYLYSKYF